MNTSKLHPHLIVIALLFGVFIAVGGSVLATSIGTNISVDGTLAVTGASTLTGNIAAGGTLTVSGLTTLANASTTLLSTTGNLMVNGYATTTASNGNIATAGTLTVTGASVLTGNITTQGSVTIGGGTAIAKHLSGTASLNFPVIAANSCQTLTMTLTGAVAGDTVALGLPDALASASSTFAWSGWVSAADTVSVRVCQVATQATSDPAAATVRADVWQH